MTTIDTIRKELGETLSNIRHLLDLTCEEESGEMVTIDRFGWESNVLNALAALERVERKQLSAQEVLSRALDLARNAGLGEAERVAGDFKMVEASPIGPLHGTGWNDAAERIAHAIHAIHAIHALQTTEPT